MAHILHQFLTDDGTRLGNKNIRVDGSTTPIDFYLQAPADGCELREFRAHRYRTTSVTAWDVLGDGCSVLAEGAGLIIGVLRSGTSTIEPLWCNHRPDDEVRQNKDLTYGPGSRIEDFVEQRHFVCFSAAHAGPVSLDSGDRVVCRVRANLLGLPSQDHRPPFFSAAIWVP